MSKRKTAVGIAMIFALALSAFSATSASASGATTYTCVRDDNGVFWGAHCQTVGSGLKHTHNAITPGTQTTYSLTNVSTSEGTTASQSSTLRGALAGVATELTCAKVSGSGTAENKSSGEEMFGHGEGTIAYTECVVKAPAGKGCKVTGGAVTTEKLTSRSLGSGAEVEVKPVAGTKFADIKIEGCSVESLNGTFPVTGTLKVNTSGSTLTCTEAGITTQNTLKFGGVKAGLEGAVTVSGHSNAGEETHPLVYTGTP